MTAEPELLALSAASPAQREAFYRRAFPARADFLIRNWRWLYRLGEGLAEPLVLVQDGAIVAHAGLIPARLRWKAEEVRAAWFVDFLVLPELQGRGLGLRLANAWMEKVPARLTYCNERSWAIFKKLGWRSTFDTECRTLDLDVPGKLAVRGWGPRVQRAGAVLALGLRALAGLGLSCAPDVAPEELPGEAELMRLFSPPLGANAGLVRDAGWVRWRFLACPYREQLRLFRNGPARAVARLFGKRAHLLFIDELPDAAAKAGLLRGVAKWALKAGLDCVWMTANDAALLGAARRALPRGRSMRFACHAQSPELQAALLRPGALGLQGADGDNDLML